MENIFFEKINDNYCVYLTKPLFDTLLTSFATYLHKKFNNATEMRTYMLLNNMRFRINYAIPSAFSKPSYELTYSKLELVEGCNVMCSCCNSIISQNETYVFSIALTPTHQFLIAEV